MIERSHLDPPKGPLNVIPNVVPCAPSPKGAEYSLAEVKAQMEVNAALESALRRFKREVQEEDIIDEIKRYSLRPKRRNPVD